MLGVIYPLSFLPVSIDQPITYSIRAFLPTLLSLKGFLLSSISITFLAIIITFWYVNLSLRYNSKETDDLRRAEVVENYSEYLRIMKENQEAQHNWAEQLKSTPV